MHKTERGDLLRPPLLIYITTIDGLMLQ